MERMIIGFHSDTEGDWVAELDCGHGQHVRHRPPFQVRPWVLDESGRAAHLRTPLRCPLCERAELPTGLRFVRRSPDWDERSLPAGLRRAHELAPGRWGRLVVEEGRVAFRASTTPRIDRMLEAGAVQAIPPSVEHEIKPAGNPRFFVEFLEVLPYGERGGRGQNQEPETEPDAGGDPACWAHLFCLECGSALSDGHLAGCPLLDQDP